LEKYAMNERGLVFTQLAKPVEIIGVACAAGARIKGCEAEPDAVRAGSLVSRLQTRGLSAAWHETIHPGRTGYDEPLQAVRSVCRRLAQRTRTIAARGGLPVIVGGDHSCAIGTWKGVASALRTRGPLGLIWIDAHMDAHTPQTTPSGALHGMPLACLFGRGDRRLTALGGGIALQPQYVCLIGVRRYESNEEALLRQLGVRIYYMVEVARRLFARRLRTGDHARGAKRRRLAHGAGTQTRRTHPAHRRRAAPSQGRARQPDRARNRQDQAGGRW